MGNKKKTVTKLHPNAIVGDCFMSAYVDMDGAFGQFLNPILEKWKSRLRVRVIVFEDAVRAVGLWTPEGARKAIDRMDIGANGIFRLRLF